MECLFCKIIKGEIPAKIIYEDELAIAFGDINPQAPIHILIIPREHIATLNDVNPDQAQIIGHLYQIAKKLAKKLNVAEDGYRTIINCNKNAGQEVFHLHLHFLAGRKFSWPPG